MSCGDTNMQSWRFKTQPIKKIEGSTKPHVLIWKNYCPK